MSDVTSPDVWEGKINIEELTQPKSWDYERFKKVMVALACAGDYVPSFNRPDSIDIGNLGRIADSLESGTKSDNKERSLPLLVDIGKKILIRGKERVGDDKSTFVDAHREPGREIFQVRMGVIHSHPEIFEHGSHPYGFSPEDYVSFLSDKNLLLAMLIVGDQRYLLLKTSVTPVGPEKSIAKQLKELDDEFFMKAPSRRVAISLVEYNKAACLEFGLTMYIANRGDSLARRVNVTNLL